MEEDDSQTTRESLIEMIGEFMTGSMNVEDLYRSHLCDTLVARVHDEFGTDGLAELIIKVEYCADWIVEMLFDDADFHNAMLKRHGTFDEEIVVKARMTMAYEEMRTKIGNLRKRYINKIVDEIWASENETEPTVPN